LPCLRFSPLMLIRRHWLIAADAAMPHFHAIFAGYFDAARLSFSLLPPPFSR
jgi:hypothetical protein